MPELIEVSFTTSDHERKGSAGLPVISPQRIGHRELLGCALVWWFNNPGPLGRGTPLQEQRHRQTQPVPAVQTAPVGPANGKSRWQHKGGSTGIALGLSCCKLLVCCASWDVALHRGWGRWSGGVVGAHCGAFILGVGCGGPGIRIGRRQLPQHVHRALKAVPPLFWVPVQIQGPDRFRRVLQLFSHHTTHQLLQHTYTRQAKPPPPAPP